MNQDLSKYFKPLTDAAYNSASNSLEDYILSNSKKMHKTDILFTQVDVFKILELIP